MTKDEALNIALDALENIASRRATEQFVIEQNAITFIKQALAQPEQEPVGEVYGWHGHGVGQPLCRFNVTESDMPVGSLLYTTQPQPEQDISKIGCVNHDCDKCKAQRTWVRLTDEELDKIYEQHHNQYGECETPNFGYERSIEAKLKEKNT